MASRPDYSLGAKRVAEVRYASEFLTSTSLHAGGSGSGGINEAIADLVAAGIGGKVIVTKPATISQRIKMWWDNIEIEGTKGAILTKNNELVKTLTADGIIGNNFVDVADVANLQVGDTVIVTDNTWTDVGGVWNSTIGEIVSIIGLRVTINNNLRHTYTVAQAARLRSVFSMFQSGFDNPNAANPKQGMALSGIRIEGNVANQSYGITNELHCAIQTYNWLNGLLEKIKIDSWHDQGINMSGQYLTLRRARITSALGFGVQFSGCYQSVMDDVMVYNMSNPGNFDYADFYFCAGNYDNLISKCASINAPNHAFRSIVTSAKDSFMQCLARTSNKNGFQIGGDRDKLLGCIARNSGANGQGFYIFGTTKAQLIGCEATREAGGPVLYDGYVLYNALDTLIMGCLAKGMRGAGGGGFNNYLNSHRTKYIGCQAYDNIGAGLKIYTSNDVEIHACTFKADVDTQAYGVKIVDANCLRIRLGTDNDLIGNTTGPYLDNNNAITPYLVNEPARALGNPYQNTTTLKPLLITITLELISGAATPATAELRVENVTPPTVVRANPSLGSIIVTSRQVLSFIVPYGWYYGVYVTAGTVNLIEWHEQEIG